MARVKSTAYDSAVDADAERAVVLGHAETETIDAAAASSSRGADDESAGTQIEYDDLFGPADDADIGMADKGSDADGSEREGDAGCYGRRGRGRCW